MIRIKRRQLIRFGTIATGVGIALLARQWLSNSSRSANRTASLVPTPPRRDVRLAVISDLNRAYGSTDYKPPVDAGIALIPEWEPDLVLCGGDMVAAQSLSLSRSQIEAMWQGFDRQIATPLRRANLPLGFAIGNHDGSGALNENGEYIFKTDREVAAAYWQQPEHVPQLNFIDRAAFPFYYTFQHRDIFILVCDASTARILPQQWRWIEASLASSQAQSAPLRLAMGHLPLYAISQGRNKPGEVLNQGDRLRSLLERYNVHTYISGHHHAYFPGRRGRLELLHAGALGSGPRQLLAGDAPPRHTLTLVDINLTPPSTRYTTYNMKTLEAIDDRLFPRTISGTNGWVLRRDLSWDDLTDEERSALRG